MEKVAHPLSVQRFRQDGIIFVDDLFRGAHLDELSRYAAAAAKRRGPSVFPAADPAHGGELQFDMKVKPKAAARLSDLPPPENLKRAMDRNDAKQALDRYVRRIDLRCKNQKRVDRLYRKFVRRRNQMHRMKNIPTVITEEEELSGEVSEERIRDIKRQFSYESVKSSFEQYRDDGRMELEIRRENYIDETLQFLENWGRHWVGFWQSFPEEVREALARAVGRAAAALTGEVSVRLYCDTLQENYPLTNGIPFHCSAPGLNFRHPHAVNVVVGLKRDSDSYCSSAPAGCRSQLVVIPGSHRVTLEITEDGRDFSRLLNQQVLDSGYLVRHTPALRDLPLVQVPDIPDGAAVIMSTFLVNATMPNFLGTPTTPYVFPTHLPSRQPDYYNLTVMPDRCTFDGQRNSWFSKDTHGPLFHYKKGDLLNDERQFPLLYRSLDID